MQFRVRSSSKKSSNNQVSLLDFSTSKTMVQESAMNRSLTSKIDHFQVVFSSFQEQYRREKEITNTSNLELQKRLDRIQYKVFTAEQDLRQLNEIKQLRPIRESFPQNSGGQSSKNEIMMLKQVILQEKEAHKQTLKHQNSIIQQLSLKQMRSEQQLRQLLNHQKNEYQIRISGQGEELREIEGYKQRKIQQQYDMIKNMISTSERRIYEDLDRRMKNQSLIKEFIEQKVNMVKEQLSSEHKMALIAETKFIKETKLSLESLFSLINNVKKELSEEVSETQKLSLKSIQRLSMAMDISRTKSTDDYKELMISNQQITSQLAQLKNYVNSQLNESRQILSKVQEQTSSKLRQSGQFENGSSIKDIGGEKLSNLQKQWNSWKVTTEQKNLNVFKEISNTLKAMKLEWRKQNDQLSSQIQAANDSLKQMKKSGPSELKKSVQTIITIFNNQFDVLAEQLESLTQMIALAKKENQKFFKEQINKQNSETLQAFKQLINQKNKESNVYTDKAILRLQENMKRQISKEIKYSTQFTSQRVQKLQGDMNTLELLVKKTNLTTAAQLEDYSLKLKTFNQNYKDYLEEQRKEDMQKRVDLQQQMRKNANSLMDIYYKKSEFLVDGLKKSVQIAQMKEKVQTAQALQVAKDQLKKQIQSSQQDQQKQLFSAVEKVTKERQASQTTLKQALEQTISVEKTNITNDISSLKTSMDNKWKQNEIKQKQKETEHEKDLLDLKNMALSMIRDEKRLSEENLLKAKKQLEDKIGVMEKNDQTRQMQQKERQVNNRRDIESMITNTANKLQTSQKEQISKTKLMIEEKAALQSKQIADLTKKIENQNKIESDRISKIDQDTRLREAEIQRKITTLNSDQQMKIKNINEKIQLQSKNTEELKLKEQQNHIKSQEDKNKSIESLKTELESKTKSLNDKIQLNSKNSETKLLQIENKIVSIKQEAEKDLIKNESQKNKTSQAIKGQLQQKNKSLSQKIQQLSKKFDDFSKGQAQKQKIKANQSTTKTIQLEKKITDLSTNVDAKNKINSDKIEQLNKKLVQISSASDKQKQKQGETKKISEQSVNQLKAEFDKKINEIDQRTREVQSKMASDDQEEAMGNIKKSVNKLEAIVFSQQAKNKAMFDRITQDITKLSENLAMVTNQIRE